MRLVDLKQKWDNKKQLKVQTGSPGAMVSVVGVVGASRSHTVRELHGQRLQRETCDKL